MTRLEERPALTIIKPASRDGRVSCETLSHFESTHRWRDVAPRRWQNGEDDERETDFQEHEAPQEHKASSSVNRLFVCFSPVTTRHILTRPVMSPGRDYRKRSDFGGITRTAVLSPTSLTNSRSVESLPLSNLTRLGAASIASHPVTLKVLSKGRIGPFTMMPADVIGHKKPPGYESQEPTSPKVTCIGSVKNNHKYCRKAMKKKALKDCKKEKWLKQSQKERKQKEMTNPRQWLWPFARKEAREILSNQDRISEPDLNPFGSSFAISAIAEGEKSVKEELPLREDCKNIENERTEAPPPNVLLRMKGCSRNWDRPNEKGVTAAEEAALVPEVAETGLMRGGSKCMDRPSSSPEVCEENL